MVLGKNFFVTPSDSVAVIADNAEECIPYFKHGKLKYDFIACVVTYSLPEELGAVCPPVQLLTCIFYYYQIVYFLLTLLRVAKKKNLECFEVPTGWVCKLNFNEFVQGGNFLET